MKIEYDTSKNILQIDGVNAADIRLTTRERYNINDALFALIVATNTAMTEE